MRKTNLFYLAVKIMLLGIFSISQVSAQCGKTHVGVPKAILEKIPCVKWVYDNYDNSNPFNYQNYEQDMMKLFATCDNAYGPFKCYWSSPWGACKARQTEQNEVTNKAIEQQSGITQAKYTKYAVIKATGSANTYRCTIGTATERKNADGEYSLLTLVGITQPLEPQSHCNTVVVNGPYRNCSDKFTLCGTQYSEAVKGFGFTITQKNKIKNINRQANNPDLRDWKKGKLKSDLAGFTYTDKYGTTTEPEFLTEHNPYQATADSPEVHHVLPKKDRQGCSCGSNSMKNAVVISRRLNQYFLNHNRENLPSGEDEISVVNAKPPYSCPQFIPAPSFNLSKTKFKKVKNRRNRK